MASFTLSSILFGQDGGFFIGGGLSFSSSYSKAEIKYDNVIVPYNEGQFNNYNYPTTSTYRITTFKMLPKFGGYVNDRFAIGVSFGLGYSFIKSTYTSTSKY